MVYTAILMVYVYRYLRARSSYTLWLWMRIPITIAALLSVYLLLPIASPLRSLYLIAAAAMLYIAEVGISKISEQGNFMGTLGAYFGLCLGLFALNFYMPNNTFVVLLLLGVVTFMVCRSSFEYVPQPDRTKNIYAALTVLCVVELSWSLVLLPLHFTALALVAFNFFYVLWMLAYYHLFQNLTAKKAAFHISFAVAIAAVAVATTPWR